MLDGAEAEFLRGLEKEGNSLALESLGVMGVCQRLESSLATVTLGFASGCLPVATVTVCKQQALRTNPSVDSSAGQSSSPCKQF